MDTINMAQQQEHGRRAAQHRVEDRRRRIMDPSKLPTTPRSKLNAQPSSMTLRSSTSQSPGPRGRRKRATSLSTNLQKLSIINTNPTFDYPQPSLPQSAQEQTLSQELALCDFRSYLLAMEAQNYERLRQARGNEWQAYDGTGMGFESPLDDSPNEATVRDEQMVAQAGELTRKRVELQVQLEGLTGREYPLPETYWGAEGIDVRTITVSILYVSLSGLTDNVKHSDRVSSALADYYDATSRR